MQKKPLEPIDTAPSLEEEAGASLRPSLSAKVDEKELVRHLGKLLDQSISQDDKWESGTSPAHVIQSHVDAYKQKHDTQRTKQSKGTETVRAERGLDERDADIVKRHKEGVSTSGIAEAKGISQRQVQRILKRDIQ
jgi:DNA-directed RNA polymerase specialized sigma subunit